MFISIVRIIFRYFVFIFIYPTKVYGIENIPDDGAAIICSNHLTYLDVFLLGYKPKRLINWLAKEELFSHKPVAWFIRKFGAIPVYRSNALSSAPAVMSALKVLGSGELLGIFPEGERVRKKKPDQIRIRMGIARIGHKSGVPIIPARIIGKIKPFHKLKVVFDKPFYVDDIIKKLQKDAGKGEQNQEISKQIYEEAAKLIMKRVYSIGDKETV